MPIYDPETKLSIVKIATAQAGPFTTLEELRTADWTHAREGTVKRYVMGSTEARVKQGRKNHSYRIAGFLDLTTTGGQDILRDAYESGNSIWLQLLPDPSAGVGAQQGWTEEVKVTEYSGSWDREGEFVEFNASFEGTGTTTAVVGA